MQGDSYTNAIELPASGEMMFAAPAAGDYWFKTSAGPGREQFDVGAFGPVHNHSTGRPWVFYADTPAGLVELTGTEGSAVVGPLPADATAFGLKVTARGAESLSVSLVPALAP